MSDERENDRTVVYRICEDCEDYQTPVAKEPCKECMAHPSLDTLSEDWTRPNWRPNNECKRMPVKRNSELTALALARIKLEAELKEWRKWLEDHGMVEKKEPGDE